MRASKLIKMLERGIEMYGDWEIRIRLPRLVTTPTKVSANEKKKVLIISTEEDDYDTSC